LKALNVLDPVALLQDIEDEHLQKGQVGTIVEKLDSNLFEVEFTNQKGETIALKKIKGEMLML
jgi:hypothetical protein